PWINDLIAWEEKERSHRSLERRLTSSHIGRFKPLSEFDWSWPKKCDRELIEELMQLNFLKEATNIILCGPSGVGKSMIACNILYQAVLRGQTVLFVTAGQMLNDLSGRDGDNALRRRLKYYVQPALLCIDEMGYLAYCNRRADLLFELISQRYQEKSTIVTTNKPFSEWGTLFPNAACVVSLIDRLVHHSEIVGIEADSFRFKEAKEKSAKRRESRSKRKSKPDNKTIQEAQ
ncbi:MAG TPA: IS21-like element helper ATPase IstB, partial [Gammaproteobacteria bacterium]|nr:IS21-like element helper ATPase IstB [Gammaproteobacteria bacterium]